MCSQAINLRVRGAPNVRTHNRSTWKCVICTLVTYQLKEESRERFLLDKELEISWCWYCRDKGVIACHTALWHRAQLLSQRHPSHTEHVAASQPANARQCHPPPITRRPCSWPRQSTRNKGPATQITGTASHNKEEEATIKDYSTCKWNVLISKAMWFFFLLELCLLNHALLNAHTLGTTLNGSTFSLHYCDYISFSLATVLVVAISMCSLAGISGYKTLNRGACVSR